MATKSANLYARIEPDVKEQAEGILAALGIPASNAINMFYKQIILQRGLPFEVKMPSARPVDVSALSEAQMNAELEKGYADMQAGRTRSAKSVFADIRKDYSLVVSLIGLKHVLWILIICRRDIDNMSWNHGKVEGYA